MNTIRISTLMKLATVTLLALSFNAGRADAQEVRGTFTLPFEVHWGLATLPPGNYSFSLDNASQGGILRLARGRKAVALIVDQSHADQASDRSDLVVVGNNTGRSILELHLPQCGVVLRYAEWKHPRNRAVEEREVAQVIPLDVAGQ